MGWDGMGVWWLGVAAACGCAPVARRLVRPVTSCRTATSQPSDSERGSCCPPRRRWQRHCRTGEARRWHGWDVRRGAPAAGWRPPTILTELVGSECQITLCWSMFFTVPRSTACRVRPGTRQGVVVCVATVIVSTKPRPCLVYFAFLYFFKEIFNI